MAHPDDAEFLCAGALALLYHKGWKIHIATLTKGDCGSKELSRSEISSIRVQEATKSVAVLNGTYEAMDFDDLLITYDRDSIKKVVGLIREVRPQLVLTMSPDCYMIDHEKTSALVQTACFGAGLTNLETPGLKALDYIPHLYYVDPMEGKNKFGERIKPTTMLDISSVIEIKTIMLSCHESQREWLQKHHGMDEYINSMKRMSEERGSEIGVRNAEGYRQHLGHAFPQDNLLLKVLPEFTRVYQG